MCEARLLPEQAPSVPRKMACNTSIYYQALSRAEVKLSRSEEVKSGIAGKLLRRQEGKTTIDGEALDDKGIGGGLGGQAGRRNNRYMKGSGAERARLEGKTLDQSAAILAGQSLGGAIHEQAVGLQEGETHNEGRSFAMEDVGMHGHINALNLDRESDLPNHRLNVTIAVLHLLVIRLHRCP